MCLQKIFGSQMVLLKFCVFFLFWSAFTLCGADDPERKCIDSPTYKCFEPYAIETKNLYAEYKNAHRIFHGLFDLSENADTLHSIIDMTTNVLIPLAAGAGSGALSAGIIPMVFLSAAITYHTSSAVIDVTHKKRCAELCTSSLAKKEASKFLAFADNYVDFMLLYNDTHSSKFSDLSTSENSIEKLKNRAKRVYGRWTPEGIKQWWNQMGRGENQGLKCLTSCSIGRGQGAANQIFKSEFETSYGYTCKMLEELPPNKINPLMRFAQMLLLEHHFVAHKDAVKTSRLYQFLAASKDGTLCAGFTKEPFKKKINMLKVFRDILIKSPKPISVFRSTRILQKIFGKPCLHKVVQEEDKGTFKKIQDCLKKEPIDIKDALGKTAFHQAAKYGNTEAMKFLVENKADFNAKDDRGYTPLHEAAKENKVTSIAFLRSAEADFNPVDFLGKTPLHLAAENGHTEAVDTLLNSGAFSSIQDYKGNTPLHLALQGDKMAVVKRLYEFADVEAKNSDGNTVLHLAAQKRSELFLTEQIVKYFVMMGADIGLKNNAGKTVLDLAKNGSYGALFQNQIYDYLQRHFDLLQAVEKNNISRIKNALADSSLNPNIKGENGETPLMIAAKKGHQDIVEALLQRQEKISQKGAVMKAGTKMNLQNDDGKTALHLAVEVGNLEIINSLLKTLKVNPKIVDNDGNTVLHVALKMWRKDIFISIFQYISPTDQKEVLEMINNDGETVSELKERSFFKK